MIHLIRDFTPNGFRKMKGYGRTEHFDPGHKGKWDSFKTHRYVKPVLKGWLLYAAAVLLIAGMVWRSWVRKEVCMAPAVPLLFGMYMVNRSNDSAFSQSQKLIGNVFILYAWKNVLYSLMEMTSAAVTRGTAGSVVWIGLAVTGILIAVSMYDNWHEMQSGFVCAVDIVCMAILWFMSLKNSQNLSLFYLLFAAMFLFAAINFVFTFVSQLIGYPEERGNILRSAFCLLLGCIPVAAAYYLSSMSALVCGLLVLALYAALSVICIVPGSIPRHNRRALLTPAMLVLAADYGISFLNARMDTPSAKAVLKMIGKFYKGPVAVPAWIAEACTKVCTVFRAPLLAVLKGINALVHLPEWMLSASGSFEGFQMYAVNHAAVYVLIAVLVSLGIELSVRLRLKKR